MTSGDRRWRAVLVSREAFRTGEPVLQTIRRLRGSERTFASADETCGETAEVYAVGVGAGDTREPTTVDHYYDALAAGERHFDFPAMVPAADGTGR